MAMKPETLFRTGRVIPFLKRLKHTAYFPIQQLSIVGDPDYLLCCRGLFVALELKDDDEEPRPLQQKKLDDVSRAYGVSICARPDNWEQVKSLLLKIDEGAKPYGHQVKVR